MRSWWPLTFNNQNLTSSFLIPSGSLSYINKLPQGVPVRSRSPECDGRTIGKYVSSCSRLQPCGIKMSKNKTVEMSRSCKPEQQFAGGNRREQSCRGGVFIKVCLITSWLGLHPPGTCCMSKTKWAQRDHNSEQERHFFKCLVSFLKFH